MNEISDVGVHLPNVCGSTRMMKQSKIGDEWSKGSFFMFVLMLKSQRLLWDPSDEEYNNEEARKEAMLELVRDMRKPLLTVPILEQKLIALKHTYKRELHRMLRNPLYKPQAWFQWVDSFMRPAVCGDKSSMKAKPTTCKITSKSHTHRKHIGNTTSSTQSKKPCKVQLKKLAALNCEKYKKVPQVLKKPNNMSDKEELMFRLNCFVTINGMLEEQEQKELFLIGQV